MYIHLKVKTKQKNESIREIRENYFEVSVKEKPENNMANNRILEILKGYFGKPNIKIINGHKNPSKLIAIED